MSWIKRFFNNSKNNIYLGRWNLQYDEKILNRIVFLANEDHCGCCQSTIDDNYYAPFVYKLME